MLYSLSAIVLALTFLASTNAFSIEVHPGASDCFIVTVSTGIPITGSYEVISPDPKYVYVTVTGPSDFLHFENKVVYNMENVDKEDASEGFFSFDSDLEGDYTMCIANGNMANNDGVARLIAFNYRAVAVGEVDYQFVGLQSELSDLREGLELLKDHQSYMNQREDVHKNALESINDKVLLWTVLEAIILVAMAFWQISYIRSFFETKRRL